MNHYVIDKSTASNSNGLFIEAYNQYLAVENFGWSEGGGAG